MSPEATQPLIDTQASMVTDAPALLAELERAQEREAAAVQRAERAEGTLAALDAALMTAVRKWAIATSPYYWVDFMDDVRAEFLQAEENRHV